MEKILLQHTSDLSIFDMDDTNRVVSGPHGFTPRKDLVLSMKRDGFRPSQPISCSRELGGRLKIFDGHNRFVVARYLGIPVYYMAYPKAHAISPLDYSKGQKVWSLKNKMEAIANTNQEYAEVLAFSERTGIPARCCFSMFAGQLAGSNNFRGNSESEFKIKDRISASKVARVFAEVKKHCPKAASINFVIAVGKAIYAEGFNVDRMVERISKNTELVKPCRSAEDYIDLLEFIYNRNLKVDKLYLKMEIEKAMNLRSFVGKVKCAN